MYLLCLLCYLFLDFHFQPFLSFSLFSLWRDAEAVVHLASYSPPFFPLKNVWKTLRKGYPGLQHLHILYFHLFTAISRVWPDWRFGMNQLHAAWKINKCQKPFLICRGADAECLPVLKGLFRTVFCQHPHPSFAVRPTFSARNNGEVWPDPSSICGLCVFLCVDAYSHMLLGKLNYSFISGGPKTLGKHVSLSVMIITCAHRVY